MRAIRWTCGVSVIAALLAGCGGGSGSSPSPVIAPISGPGAGSSQQSSKKAVATATMRIAFPASFHTAKLPKSTKTSSKRHAAYVNPGNYYLDVYVVDQSTGSITMPVSYASISTAATDGSQVYSIPLYSTDQQDIVAIESEDGPSSTILSVGETDLGAGSFAIGSAPTIQLSMQMNALNVGLMTGQSDADGDATAFYAGSTGNSWNFSGSSGVCGSIGYPAIAGPFYAFGTDDTGGFANYAYSPGQQTGVGGIPVPTLSTFALDQITGGVTVSNAASGNSQEVGFEEIFTTSISTYTGATFTFAMSNPAGVLANDVLNNGGSVYPGLWSVEFNYWGYDYLGLTNIPINPGKTSIDVQAICGG